MKILIIIPAYNEANNITELLKKFDKLNLSLDILVIDDASEDVTSLLAHNMGVEVIRLPFNLGIGGTVQTGYLYAYYNDYDVAIQVDGDGQHNPEYIDTLIKPLFNNEADMVIGSRFIEGKGFQSSFIRRIGIKYFENLIFFITGKRYTDPTSGFRACNRKVLTNFVKYYPSDYPEPESLVSTIRKKFRVVEVPVVMNERKQGKSSIRSLKIIYYMFKVTLAIIIDIFKKR